MIQTGTRTVVMLAEDNGTFRPVEVEIGLESGGQTEVKRGLQAGQRVVVSSQFLIDSEASLKGVASAVERRAHGSRAAPQPSQQHTGRSNVESVEAGCDHAVARPHRVTEVGQR